MKRYTKSVNVRFEPLIEEYLSKILMTDSKCKKQGWNKSDLIRHFTRVGIKSWEKNIKTYPERY